METSLEDKWREIKEKYGELTMGTYEPTKYGTGFATTTTEIRSTSPIDVTYGGVIRIETNDHSTIVININNNFIEFDGIQITTEMLRNATKKIKEQEEYDKIPF